MPVGIKLVNLLLKNMKFIISVSSLLFSILLAKKKYVFGSGI